MYLVYILCMPSDDNRLWSLTAGEFYLFMGRHLFIWLFLLLAFCTHIVYPIYTLYVSAIRIFAYTLSMRTHSFAYQEFIIFSNLILAHARSGKFKSVGPWNAFCSFIFLLASPEKQTKDRAQKEMLSCYVVDGWEFFRFSIEYCAMSSKEVRIKSVNASIKYRWLA